MMENQPLVSVVVPCYQSAGTVERTIRSIQAQTVRNWELIAVDDGSRDNTLEVLERIAKEEPRMRVIHQDNGGVSCARNAGIEEAQGKWISFVDADDHLTENALQVLLELTDDQADVVCGAYLVRYADEKLPECKYTCKTGHRQDILESLIRGDSALNSPCARLYRTELIQKGGLRFPKGVKIGEDVLFNLDVFFAARAWRMTEQTIYLYEFGGDSAMVRAGNERYSRTEPMLRGIGRFLESHQMSTALFRAHVDIYVRTLRADQGRLKAALSMNRKMVASMTKNVQFGKLPVKQKAYYLALLACPALSYLLP